MATFLYSCHNADNFVNESIQNHFLGISFGDTPEKVKEKLDSIGLSTSDRLEHDGRMTYLFSSRFANDKDYFSFGGYSWKFLHTHFSGNHLFEVEFMNPYKTKEGASVRYNDLVSSLTERYNMLPQRSLDTLIYGCYIGLTRNGQYVTVSYYRYESVGHEMWYGTELCYGDRNYFQENDEL